MPLNVRPVAETEFDLVSLGECMIRLSPPGHERLEFAPCLEVHVGGAEYNVAYALSPLACAPGGWGALWTIPWAASCATMPGPAGWTSPRP